MAESKKKHTVRNVILGLLLLLFLGAGILLLIDYRKFAKSDDPYKTFILPRLEVGVFELTSLDLDKTEMVGHMLIHSPLPFNLRADSLQYKIYISGEEVIKSTYRESMNIRKWDSTW